MTEDLATDRFDREERSHAEWCPCTDASHEDEVCPNCRRLAHNPVDLGVWGKCANAFHDARQGEQG